VGDLGGHDLQQIAEAEVAVAGLVPPWRHGAVEGADRRGVPVGEVEHGPGATQHAGVDQQLHGLLEGLPLAAASSASVATWIASRSPAAAAATTFGRGGSAMPTLGSRDRSASEPDAAARADQGPLAVVELAVVPAAGAAAVVAHARASGPAVQQDPLGAGRGRIAAPGDGHHRPPGVA
jgi:hypothetical protein